MKNKVYIATIAILVIICLVLWIQKNDYRYTLKYEHVIPHVELISAMAFYGIDVMYGEVLSSSNPNDIAIGGITGYVKFPNVSDQPKGAWQYYHIEATSEYAEDGTQVFMLQEFMKLPAISTRAFDKEILKVTSNTPQSVTLESESGQSFKINKRSDEVTVIDADGDIVGLVTDDSEYRDFMMEFLNE